MRIIRTYLNIITTKGEFHALDAKGEIERDKALDMARQHDAAKAVLYYCKEDALISEPDILIDGDVVVAQEDGLY